MDLIGACGLNWLKDYKQKIMRVTRGKISSRVMKGADSGLFLFNIFISNLEERTNSMLMKCTNTKLGGVTNTSEDRNIIQRP